MQISGLQSTAPITLFFMRFAQSMHWMDLTVASTAGVIAHFNQEYVKTGVFEKGASKIIRNALELREQADYEDFYEATQEEASDVFMQASQFILEVECYLHSKSIL